MHLFSPHLLSWIDLRTLVASQAPLAFIFAAVLYGIRRVYPHLRGTETIAAGFFLAVPATLLTVAQGSISPIASVILANLLLIGSYLLLYRGTLSFLNTRGLMPLLYDVAAVAAAVLIYFTVIYDFALPRTVAIAVFLAAARALLAVELYRSAAKEGTQHRRTLELFAVFLSVFAVIPLCFAVLSLVPATIPGGIGHGTIQRLAGVADLAFLCLNGLFALTLYLGEIDQVVQQQGQLDFVTGTLNRRVIEDSLTIEIARSGRTHSPVSVLMIEVDHFKAIADTHGRSRSDQTLCTVVSTIASILRFYDKCGRIADDRFLVVLPENAGEHAMVIASRFRAALKDWNLPHDQPAITLSIGATQCVFKEPTAEVLARAELALYEARKTGDVACLKFEHQQELKAAQPKNLDRLRTSRRIAKLIR